MAGSPNRHVANATAQSLRSTVSPLAGSLHLSTGPFPNPASSNDIEQAAYSSLDPCPRPENGASKTNNLNRAQEPRTESDAKSMATVIKGEVITSDVVSESTVAERPKSRSRASKGKGKAAEATQETPETQTATTPETASVASEASANQQEPYFTHATGGYEALSPTQRAQADEAFGKWAAKDPVSAEKQGVEGYCAFRQKMTAEREAAATRDTEHTGNEAGAPSEQSWRRQRGGVENLNDAQRAQAHTEYEKAAAENPRTAEHGFESFVSYVQDRCREDFALGAAARRAHQNVDKGAVQLVDDKLTRKFMETVYDGKSTGNDALRVLQASVEPGGSKTQNFKNLFSVEVQRKGDNSIVRTTLIPAEGKHAEIKQALDKIARQSFARSGQTRTQEPRQQQRDTKAHANDMGR